MSIDYVVLRPDLATCVIRARQRRSSDADDLESFARLHARFADLGRYEANVVDPRVTRGGRLGGLGPVPVR